MKSNAYPLVALIGRPNVGKSTLFNRITRRRDAIVDPTPGVTRDRHYAQAVWEEHAFMLVDTGGIEEADGPDHDQFSDHIRTQALQAVEEADVILLLLDGRQGVLPGDYEIVELLRRTDKEVFFVVNKIDSPAVETELLTPFWELGVPELWALSGDHGYGFRTLMEDLVEKLGATEGPAELPEGTARLAFFG
ncbi:50S ribosome-binding GTPase, partial [Desulfobulbus sp. US1]|nr:50S ribosome-binding GTPase [Desulfobulbus sp. US1]